MVKINGQNHDIAGKTLAEYLDSASYDVKRIAVEINDSIVPRSEYGNVVLNNDDVVEVVSFVGGG